MQLLQDAPASVLEDPEITALKSKFDLRPAENEPDPTADLSAKVKASPDDLDARLQSLKPKARNPKSLQMAAAGYRLFFMHNLALPSPRISTS